MFFGAIIVMATGAALGVLFAPAKGSTTRRKLLLQGSSKVDDLKNTANDYVDSIEERIESVRTTANDLTDTVKDAVDSLASNKLQKHAPRA